MKQFFSTLLLLFFAGCTQPEQDQVTIAAAANMQYAIQEIRDAFYKSTGIETQVVISSSGKLSSQIIEGAPFDIFISADTVYPNFLFERGKTLGKPIIYTYGQLIVWSRNHSMEWGPGIFEMDRIAIANPSFAPYGVAAQKVMTQLQVYDKVANRLVFGESVAQTNQYILSGAADFGFTARSIVQSNQMQGVGSWAEVPLDLYGGIPQAAVAIKHLDQNRKVTLEFLQFLSSDEAQTILEKFGYIDDITQIPSTKGN